MVECFYKADTLGLKTFGYWLRPYLNKSDCTSFIVIVTMHLVTAYASPQMEKIKYEAMAQFHIRIMIFLKMCSAPMNFKTLLKIII